MPDHDLNRGSDFRMVGVFRDETLAACDLTGWAIAAYDTTEAFAGLDVEWTDPSAGAFAATLEWDEAIPTGRLSNFRIRISKDGVDISSPQIWVNVQ